MAVAAPPPPSGASRGAASVPRADTTTLTDDRGRAVPLPTPARRIVSLVPALTEILFAIGAGDRVVGRTRFDTDPPEARAVPSVGDGIRPSEELILSRRPDLVLLYAGPDNRGVAERLEELGVPVLGIRHDTLGDLERNILRVGRATGCEAEARALAAGIRERLRAVARATAALPARRVYYDVWGEPPITVGGGSYLDSLIAIAGGDNVFGDLSAPSPRVSLEAIVTRRPEVVLFPVEGGAEDARRPPAERPGWSVLDAVRRGAVRTVDADLLHRLGPRVGDAAAALAGAIHPEAAVGAPAAPRPSVAAVRCGGSP